MSQITIADLEVLYRVGVTEEERRQPQKLLITVKLTHDLGLAAERDDLEHTIDYFQVAQLLLNFGQDKSWRLIEKVATDAANAILNVFGPVSVSVEVKKFVIPQAAYVSVTCEKSV